MTVPFCMKIKKMWMLIRNIFFNNIHVYFCYIIWSHRLTWNEMIMIWAFSLIFFPLTRKNNSINWIQSIAVLASVTIKYGPNTTEYLLEQSPLEVSDIYGPGNNGCQKIYNDNLSFKKEGNLSKKSPFKKKVAHRFRVC